MPCGWLRALYAAGIHRPFEPGFVGECDQLVWFRVCGSSPAYLASIFTSGFCLCAFACISFAIWLHLEAAANRAEGISAGSYTGPPAVLSEPSEASTWDVVPPLPATPERRTTSWAQGSARSNSSAYDDVARSIPDLPEACIELCNRLSGTPSSVPELYEPGTLAVGQEQFRKAVSESQDLHHILDFRTISTSSCEPEDLIFPQLLHR